MKAKGGMCKQSQPMPMKDRFAGSVGTISTASKKRSFDTGTGSKGYTGAPVAHYKGTVRGQKSDAGFNNSNTKVRGSNTSLGGGKAPLLGRPVGAAPSYPGLTLGHGPKTGSHATGAIKQMGKSGGADKSPRAMRDRFKGGSHT